MHLRLYRHHFFTLVEKILANSENLHHHHLHCSLRANLIRNFIVFPVSCWFFPNFCFVVACGFFWTRARHLLSFLLFVVLPTVSSWQAVVMQNFRWQYTFKSLQNRYRIAPRVAKYFFYSWTHPAARFKFGAWAASGSVAVTVILPPRLPSFRRRGDNGQDDSANFVHPLKGLTVENCPVFWLNGPV